ncbi:MAG: hypothetical protein A3D31_03650 [Candidatus Fluviicola riflensis]|nr:MAG: hypothetical protein CHH17_11380 [Candidatus Fluviicola riflensis]OGS79072.1 MAG: hypothetical protein A3D31_03650 [Candidatus Fluviicola riflensis]OGS86095.1 MAG: hypothetical protein A3E30_11140 [Fluviicola sp. RIFCSPHIGHO2_12_FULL_43_24]OGS86504.1 MAG: hypothetical protein A2724_03110 [Fluviicola sp. RIFCSPHIGHO2_01_FULL_43_53]
MAFVNADIEDSPLFQSGYTYLQAVGSDGTDETVSGRHLKWDFLKLLGDQHLPKGDYTGIAPYVTADGFNKSNDYVRILRHKFEGKPYHVQLITTNAPGEVVQLDGKWNWMYELPINGDAATRETNVRLIFTDTLHYNTLLADFGGTLTGNWKEFLSAYAGVVELHADDKLAFYYEFAAVKAKVELPYSLRVEAVGTPDSLDPATKQLNVRKHFTVTSENKFFSENTKYIRFATSNVEITSIYLITYKDFILASNASGGRDGAWTEIGNSFALTIDDTRMSDRFMATDVDGTGGHWPKFNNTTPSGEFTINKENYTQRWRRDGFSFNSITDDTNDPISLQHFIHTYLIRSVGDPKAILAIPSDDPEDVAVQQASYLELLKLLSLDYHLSRIFGLGHIDKSTDSYSYVYCMEYVTTAPLEVPYDEGVLRTHLYMTLPTSKTDYRVPKAPVLDDLTFGVEIDNGTGTPSLLTDINGYAPHENLRFININRGKYNHELAFGPFFYSTYEFDLSLETQPVAYGLEYKEQSESGYRKPEINHDTEYEDVTGIPETVPILENGTPRLFTHQEEEEGTHVYAAYAINWFSRISPLSNTKDATTTFPKVARLLPPFNYATQLIQDEDPAEVEIEDKTLILTTQLEQHLLADLPDSSVDKTLVRTTFDWNHVHNHAHPTIDYAEFFFREDEPMVVKGKVTAVTMLDADTAIVEIGSYQITSAFPAETVQPVISAPNSAKFIGSFLSTGSSHFVIEGFDTTGTNPKFKVKALKQNQASAPDPANQNQFLSQETIELPQVGDLFFTIENMSDPSNWDLKHNTKVYIEKNYSNASIGLRYSPTNVVKYGIKSLEFVTGSTVITLHEPLKSELADGTVKAEYTVRLEIIEQSASQLKIKGDWTTILVTGTSVRIFGNEFNDGAYTLTGTPTYNGTLDLTTVTITGTLPNAELVDGVLDFTVNRVLTVASQSTNKVTIAGDRLAEINAANIEYVLENDGTSSRFVVGGIVTEFTMEPLLDDNGNGTGFIQLFSPHTLLPHTDSRVSWNKGTIRLEDVSGKKQVYPVSYLGNLTSTSFNDLAVVIQDPGFVPLNPEDVSPADVYTLDLNTSQTGTYHPSYKIYLEHAEGLHPVTGAAIVTGGVHFDDAAILPVTNAPTSGNKQTLMSVRSVDVKNNLQSFLATPTVLLAQKITAPLAPAQPQGPLYATRPDFYGKSTYTFDTQINTEGGRAPYALAFFRASNDAILDILYTQDTIKGNPELEIVGIKEEWALLPDSFANDPQLWDILINTIADPDDASEFKELVTSNGSFRWPMPNNPDFFITFETTLPLTGPGAYVPSGGLCKPFSLLPEDEQPFTLTRDKNVYGKTLKGAAIIRLAIQQAFIALNEQPPVFAHLKADMPTSSKPSVLRDTNGNILDPLTNDIYPMVRTFEKEGETYVRFTDYSLDGASINLYFYRAMEMDDKFKLSEPSGTLGPVKMVNSFAPDQPQIRKAITQLPNVELEQPSAVLFELNAYGKNEKITKLEIYRCIDELDSLSVRTMKKVKTILWGDPVTDDFSDIDFPLYGESLYYRMVAIREVRDVQNVLNGNATIIVDVPSRPSDVVRTTLVDPVNPEAPDLAFIFGDVTETAFEEVQIVWSPTCYNGTYSLQKMNSSGNWNEIYKIKQATGGLSYPPLDGLGMPDFTGFTATVTLPREDEDENPIYHRFRVEVENASGLFNLTHKEFICDQHFLSVDGEDNLGLEDNSGAIII